MSTDLEPDTSPRWIGDGPVQFMGFERVDADGRVLRERKIERGAAHLWLGPTELRVARAEPPAEWILPLARVTGVETAKSHSGRRVYGYLHLRVAYVEDGQVEVLGVLIGKKHAASAWLEQVRAAVRAAGGADVPIAGR